MTKKSSVFEYKTKEYRLNVLSIDVGKLNKIKVADMEALIKQIREERAKAGMNMRIEIKAIRTKREKEISKVVRFAKDPINGIHYGIMSGELPDGNVRWRGIFLTDYNSFDLNNDLEAKCYAVLRMHPALTGCPFQTVEEPMFQIIDPNQIANDKFTKAMKVGQALQIIKTMKKSDVAPFARFMDLQFEEDQVNNRYLKAMLTDLAMNDPELFIRNHQDPNRSLFEMVALAKHYGIIVFNVDKGHHIGSTYLGYSTPDAVSHLNAQTEVTARIRAKLQEAGAYKDDEEADKEDEEDD